MPRAKKTKQSQNKREFPGPILTLSLWQLRQIDAVFERGL